KLPIPSPPGYCSLALQGHFLLRRIISHSNTRPYHSNPSHPHAIFLHYHHMADSELILSEGRLRIIVPLSHQQVSPWPFKGLASGTKKAEREGVFGLERAAPGLQVSAWFSA
ncbi:hypothetical protein KUCAC02_027343, partial [Chaenocephalus aceratus]